MQVKIKKLDETADIPVYATTGSAGFDLVINNFKWYYSNRTNPENVNALSIIIPTETGLLMNPFSRVLIGCGFAIELPEGYELDIRSRSGLALKKGIIVLNSPGTIDSDYRGEIGAIICNNSQFPVEIKIGERIAQAVLIKVEQAELIETNMLSETKRGEGGFGSTDKQPSTKNY
jgi:dUTP pyrophosphatase